LGLATILVACQDGTQPTAPAQPDASRAAPTSRARLGGADREAADLATKVPGFAGMYFDESGAPVVQLVDMGRREAARGAVAQLLQARGRSAASLRFAQARYDFGQLAAWRQHFPEVFAVGGVITGAINRHANRLRFGVVDAAAAGRVRARTAELGIPAAAVETYETSPTRLYTTLADYMRPVPGGVQFEFTPDDGANTFGCTVGFSAYTYGETDMKVLTNSHCTKYRGQVNSTNFYQPTRTTSSNRFAIEVKDPALLTGGACPSGYQCRYSDAAVGTYYTATGDFGKLARPAARSTSASGTTTLDSSTPRITVSSMAPYPYEGETLDKVGAATGWTTGTVTESCVDIVAEPGILLWCQDKVGAGAWHGDSGSPVFYYVNGQAIIVGLLWGGPGVSPSDKVFYMSEMDGLGADGINVTSVH
jgi:hypothetical protein